MRIRSVGALGVMIALASAALTGCDSLARDEAPRSIFDGADSRRAIDPVRISTPSLLYAKGRTLYEVELATGARHRLGRLATPELFAAPAGRFIAEVVPRETDPDAERDFLLEPELRLLELETGREAIVGRGFAPLWHSRDDVVAYLRPRAPRRCSSEGCETRSEVVRLDVSSGREEVLLPAGRWTLLSWLGDGVLVAEANRVGRVLWVARGDDRRRVPFAPSEIWGGSPDGRWLIAGRGGEMGMHAVDDGSVEPRGAPLELGRGVLAEGAWARDSSVVAAATLDPSKGIARGSRVVVFSVDDPDARPIPGLFGVTGPVLLSRDAGTVITSRASGAGGLRLQAVACDLEARPRCRGLFSWVRGLTLLALSG